MEKNRAREIIAAARAAAYLRASSVPLSRTGASG
jgi:hypothetical protein